MSKTISRRKFIRRATCFAGAAALGPSIVPPSVLGRDGAVAPGSRIGLGFIGLGGRGNGIAPGFLGADTQAIAVCDVWSNRAEAAMKRFKAARAYTDFRELLARDDIDAVVIATPEHWHVPIAVAAARGGKDLYCEKSLGTTVAEGRICSDTIRRYGRIFQFGTMQRSSQNFRHACELVRNGRIGKLHTITTCVPAGGADPLLPPGPPPKELDFDMWLGPAPGIPYVGQALDDRWAGMPDYAPGFLSTWGVHHVDIAHWGNDTDLTGPVEVEGKGEYLNREFCNIANEWRAECTYANGVKLIHCSSGKAPLPLRDEGVLFEGTEGKVHVSRSSYETTPASLKTSVIRPDEIHLCRSFNHAGNFLECVRTRRHPICTVEAAHRATTVSLICDIAMRLERKLKWDPVAERFPDSEAANRMLSRAMRAPWQV